jgi:hypothetical protein
MRLVSWTIASSVWPFAAARVSDTPEGCAKSTLPAISALIEPSPLICVVFMSTPCFS